MTVLSDFPERFEDIQQSLGRIESRQLLLSKSLNIQDFEFKAFSQNGEDGVIQFLINNVPIEPYNSLYLENCTTHIPKK